MINLLKIISELQIDKGVYYPNDSSIEVTKAALRKKRKFLEIGTGSGFTSIVLYLNGFNGLATDISSKAINCAKVNFSRFCINKNPIISDLFESIKEKFDLIIFNPPTNINEDEKDRSLKNYLKKKVPRFILIKLVMLYHLIYSKKRRKYILNFISSAKEYLNDNGEVIINLIRSDEKYFMRKLKNHKIEIFSANDESSIFIVRY